MPICCYVMTEVHYLQLLEALSKFDWNGWPTEDFDSVNGKGHKY
jgi:hypothetical protein